MSDLGRVASKASKTSGINAARRCGACSMRLLDIVTARRRAHGKRTRCTTSFFNASSSERRSLNVPRRSMGAVGRRGSGRRGRTSAMVAWYGRTSEKSRQGFSESHHPGVDPD